MVFSELCVYITLALPEIFVFSLQVLDLTIQLIDSIMIRLLGFVVCSADVIVVASETQVFVFSAEIKCK